VAAYTPVEFQPGMSLHEFLQSFGTEAVYPQPVRRWQRVKV